MPLCGLPTFRLCYYYLNKIKTSSSRCVRNTVHSSLAYSSRERRRKWNKYINKNKKQHERDASIRMIFVWKNLCIIAQCFFIYFLGKSNEKNKTGMLNVYLFAIALEMAQISLNLNWRRSEMEERKNKLYRRIATTYWILNDVSSYVAGEGRWNRNIAAQQVCASNKIRMKLMRWVGFQFRTHANVNGSQLPHTHCLTDDYAHCILINSNPNWFWCVRNSWQSFSYGTYAKQGEQVELWTMSQRPHPKFTLIVYCLPVFYVIRRRWLRFLQRWHRTHRNTDAVIISITIAMIHSTNGYNGCAKPWKKTNHWSICQPPLALPPNYWIWMSKTPAVSYVPLTSDEFDYMPVWWQMQSICHHI